MRAFILMNDLTSRSILRRLCNKFMILLDINSLLGMDWFKLFGNYILLTGRCR